MMARYMTQAEAQAAAAQERIDTYVRAHGPVTEAEATRLRSGYPAGSGVLSQAGTASLPAPRYQQGIMTQAEAEQSAAQGRVDAYVRAHGQVTEAEAARLRDGQPVDYAPGLVPGFGALSSASVSRRAPANQPRMPMTEAEASRLQHPDGSSWWQTVAS